MNSRTLLVKYVCNDAQNFCALFHGKHETRLMDMSKEEQKDIISKDINLLTLALFAAIRSGKHFDVIDPHEVINNIVKYAEHEHAAIEKGIQQPVPMVVLEDELQDSTVPE